MNCAARSPRGSLTCGLAASSRATRHSLGFGLTWEKHAAEGEGEPPRFRLTSAAERDLRQACEYIADPDAAAAIRLLDELRHALEQLASLPGLGHRRADLTQENLRFWPFHRYLIVYAPTTQPLVILRILHGARDAERQL